MSEQPPGLSPALAHLVPENPKTPSLWANADDIAVFFGVPVSEARKIMKAVDWGAGHVPRKNLWHLLLTGLEQHKGTVSEVAAKWEKAKKPTPRQPLSWNTRHRILERDGRRCRYCNAKRKLTIDHLVPVSGGGNDGDLNLVVACQPCNSSKNARSCRAAGLILLPLADDPDLSREQARLVGQFFDGAVPHDAQKPRFYRDHYTVVWRRGSYDWVGVTLADRRGDGFEWSHVYGRSPVEVEDQLDALMRPDSLRSRL